MLSYHTTYKQISSHIYNNHEELISQKMKDYSVNVIDSVSQYEYQYYGPHKTEKEANKAATKLAKRFWKKSNEFKKMCKDNGLEIWWFSETLGSIEILGNNLGNETFIRIEEDEIGKPSFSLEGVINFEQVRGYEKRPKKFIKHVLENMSRIKDDLLIHEG